jgi:hypothetical protein
MVTWQKAIKEFKAEKQDHDGEAATIILMYLAIKRKDYPYHMASIFKKELKKENGWDEDKLKYLRSLKDKNQLTILLPKMEKKGFLESIKEQSKRLSRNYSVKTEILSSPFADIGFRKLYYDLLNKKEPRKDEACDREVARNFLSNFGVR